MNVLLPMAGKNKYFPEHQYAYPMALIEIGQLTVIERVLNNLKTIGSSVFFTFVVSRADCRRFHLDRSLEIITDRCCRIIRLDHETQGAACSALMGISQISGDSPLIIANSDQIFDDPLSDLVSSFADADAGVPTFESVHPRWSYVRSNADGMVFEAAEKSPISREAVAGLYYFRRGQDFVESAMRSIKKRASIDGQFYISPALNEMILMGRTVRAVKLGSGRYHTLYSPKKVEEYERRLNLAES